VSVYYGDRGVCEALKRRSRPVNGPIWAGLESVNALFAILFQNHIIILKKKNLFDNFYRSTRIPQQKVVIFAGMAGGAAR